jgi:RNA polymerase sigma factor (sigma-70 family)
MHTAKLNRVVRHLRAAAGPLATGPTDRQLLHGFCARGDQAAFAALLGRHGPMVLRVCRRVLRHEQDAEDAFQATFLVLARRAGSIRRTEALASWLHGVAHRVALRARRDAGRRRAHEREAQPMPARTAGSGEADWREVQAALDEEIRALPEKYRAAFVLCFLEGKSRAEAAGELGLKEGTVWSRLAQARKLLQERLGRRGISLPVLLAAAALSGGAAVAVPARLVDSTVRAVLPAGAVPERVAALARGVSRTMSTAKVNAVLLCLVTTGLLVFGGVFLKADVPAPTPAEERAEPRPAAAVAEGTRSADPAGAAQPAPDPDDPKSAGRFSGRVNGPDGKPLGGARVYVVPFNGANKDAGPVRATTDADGRFAFDAPDMTYTEFDGLPARREAVVIATKDGYGPDLQRTWGHDHGGLHTHWDPVKGAEVNLHLAKDDVPIHGRFLGPDGKPLAGARVRLAGLMVPRDRNLNAHLAIVSRESAELLSTDYERETYRPYLLPGLTTETRTDADGRFTLPGLGRDRLAHLNVSAPSVVDTGLTVMTRDAPDVALYGGRTGEVIHGASFTRQLKPGLTVKGVVRDRDTKAPIPGMWVATYWNPLADPRAAAETVVTDANGRFTVSGLDPELLKLAPDRRTVRAIPRPGGQHFMANGTIERDEIVIECARGIPFRLKLVDEQGRPAEGTVEYVPIDPNPQIEELVRPLETYNWPIKPRAARQPDGTYEGHVLPGPGAVGVKMSDWWSYRPAHVEPKMFFEPGRKNWPEWSFSIYGTHNTLASRGQWVNQHDYAAIVLVNAPKGSGPLELSATVVRDRPRQVSLFDPGGNPVVGAVAYLYERYGPQQVEEHLRGASFPLTGLLPDRDQRITFVKADRKLVAFLRARGDGDAPYTVQMKPWGSVTGRFVGADGKPLKVWFGPNRGALVDNDDPEGSAFYTTNVEEDGRFRIDGLVPGQSYSCGRIYYGTSEIAPAAVFEKLVLRPGEVRDVSDVRIKLSAGK